MKTIVCDNYEELSLQSAKLIAAQLSQKPDSILGLATGSTPVGMYKKLIEMNQKGELDFSAVTSFNLDEYFPITPDNPQSYRYFMEKNLFEHINIRRECTFVPAGNAKDVEAECLRYDAAIDEAGGIDLQVLGIGQNGHIGFNEPDDYLYCGTHLTPLTESTINANARFFASADEVPKHAVTMGMKSILKARTIILLASGKSKHEAVSALLDDRITTDCPATLLKLHSNVILICDKDAYNG